MDIQYREYSMQNEYTFGCILFKNFIYLQSYAYVLTVHPLSLTITLIVLRYHKRTVLSMSHSNRIPKLCQEDSFLR